MAFLKNQLLNGQTFLHPHVGGGLTHAKAKIKTLYGLAKSDWKVENKTMSYNVIIPANTTGTVTLSTNNIKNINIKNSKGQSLDNSSLKQSGNTVSMNLGSGNYTFTYPI